MEAFDVWPRCSGCLLLAPCFTFMLWLEHEILGMEVNDNMYKDYEHVFCISLYLASLAPCLT